jgi:hypothetical protein
MKKGVLLSLVVACILFATTWLTAQQICNNTVGTQGEWTYEYWKDNGNGCMVLGSGGAFSCDWSNINNLLARKGLRPGTKDLKVTYTADYQPNGNSYLCVYGWTKSPLVEYYIVDSWGTWRPPGGEGFQGTVSADGATYDIYKTMRYNQPSIEGTQTFPQFWSVRQQKRTSGTITVGTHFNAWAGKGMTMGNLYEVSFCVEGYQSSGKANISSMSMTTGNVTPTPTATPTRTPTATPTRTPTPTPTVGRMGDVNGDNAININDALLIARYSAGYQPTPFNATLADVDRNGSIQITDALRVAQCSASTGSCTF